MIDKHVVVIGAGAGGLAVLRAMQRAGFRRVECLEMAADVGGVWSKVDYPDLTTHSRAHNYRYADYRPIATRNEQASRDEVLQYFHDFTRDHALREHIRFGVRVESIAYRPGQSPACELTVVDTETGEREPLRCDIVVCALGFSNAGTPNRPQLPGESDFRGTVVHSSEFDRAMLEDILDNDRRAVVVGAGKSAQDILCSLARRGHQRMACVYRKALWAYSYEFMYGRMGPRQSALVAYAFALGKLRKAMGHSELMHRLSRPLVREGFIVNPFEPDSDVFLHRGAVLRADQAELLRAVARTKAGVQGLEPDALITDEGERLPADYVILATGYRRAANLPEIRIVREGGEQGYDPRLRPSLHRQMVDPVIPAVSLFSAEIIFPQQAFGFSIAAEWLARFHAHRLHRQPTVAQMEQALAREEGTTTPWCATGRNDSGGMPYSFEVSHIIDTLVSLFRDLGLPARLARQSYTQFADEQQFDRLCKAIELRLHGTERVRPRAFAVMSRLQRSVRL
ncbi:MAG: NAD(P)/FAD-dependent oxidoreductase [Myxococcota bacterium]